MQEIAARKRSSVLNTKVRLLTMKSTFLKKVYFSTIRDVDSDKEVISGPVESERRVQRAFETNRLGSFSVKMGSLVLV